MTTLAARARRLLARRPALHLWYVALVFLWMCGFGGITLLGAQMMQCPHGGCNMLTQVGTMLAGLAAELWPPAGISGAVFLLLYWSPVLFAPFGLTRPDHKELY